MRRRPRGRLVVVGSLFVAAGAVWGSAFLFIHPVPPVRSATVALPAAPPPAEPPPTISPGPDLLPVFAQVAGVQLRMVSERAVAVAFHEASLPDALELRPVGRCRVCRNAKKFSPPVADSSGQPYVVMDARGRSTPATSAVDTVLPRGETVLAPVSGTVARVTRYRLYGRYWDARVEIRPDGAPRHRVVVIHLMGVMLERGDRVEASATRLGVPRRFPFESQVDRYVPGGRPHVHLEVKRPAPRRADSKP
ncbi:MAG: hypothetical protein ACRDI0_01640 [Actinomycetota bacterium]